MTDARTLAEIADVVKTYVHGMCGNDPDKLRAAMHRDMACIGHFDGGLEWINRDAFIATVNAAVDTPDPAPWYRINTVSVFGDVAMVQVENIWLGMHYDDTLSLLNHDGHWVIVSKVFHHRQPG